MHTRLLSFLTAIESALTAPVPAAGEWRPARAVNYHRGLARLHLVIETADGPRPLGSVQVQGYQLADESACLRIVLGWAGREAPAVHTLCARPGLDWDAEARRLAAAWHEGRVPPLAAETSDTPLLASG